ncbi:hypothetical protein E4K73_31875 [Streptomyces sp. IB201691-2A2]|nr:hypothetical protein E4K73_31875 [Streptomyces sp. IB201691-2A2]
MLLLRAWPRPCPGLVPDDVLEAVDRAHRTGPTGVGDEAGDHSRLPPDPPFIAGTWLVGAIALAVFGPLTRSARLAEAERQRASVPA